jgi:hypothetical protein
MEIHSCFMWGPGRLAYRALFLIGTPAPIGALRHIHHGTNADFKAKMQRGPGRAIGKLPMRAGGTQKGPAVFAVTSFSLVAGESKWSSGLAP